MTILARGSGATLVTALTASPKAKDLFQQVWVTNGAGVFQNKSLEMANTENKVKEGRIDTLLFFSRLNFLQEKLICGYFSYVQAMLLARAPILPKINQCHFGYLRLFVTGRPKCLQNFRAGQKNNQCHGTVALARWAPLCIRYIIFSALIESYL